MLCIHACYALLEGVAVYLCMSAKLYECLFVFMCRATCVRVLVMCVLVVVGLNGITRSATEIIRKASRWLATMDKIYNTDPQLFPDMMETDKTMTLWLDWLWNRLRVHLDQLISRLKSAVAKHGLVLKYFLYDDVHLTTTKQINFVLIYKSMRQTRTQDISQNFH